MAPSAEAMRARVLIEESRESILVVDADNRVLVASRRARETFPDVAEGQPLPAGLWADERGAVALEIPYAVGDQTERIVYLSRPGDMRAYEELRAGFTAAVSHELRTPLARLLALLESLELPGADVEATVEQARREIAQMGELIDDVLFLGELETGHEVVGLGPTPVLAIFHETANDYADRADRAGLSLAVVGDEAALVDVRPRMLRVMALNFIENALRYAGPDCTLTLTVAREGGFVTLTAADTGVGVSPEAMPRLFERFFRADSARASRGTGLGLAIVKHITNSAGGRVEAESTPGGGLTIRCVLPEAPTGGGRSGA